MNAMVERTADSILRQMDKEFIDLVEYEPKGRTTNSPEREVHVEECNPPIDHFKNLTVTCSKGGPRPMLLHCSSVLETRRNPEVTSPLSVDCDDWSLSSSTSLQLGGNAKNALTKSGSAFYLGDDESEVSLLLDEGEASAQLQAYGSSGIINSNEDAASVASIQDAVDAIREEAARMETAFAIDRLQTLESEIRSMKKLLHAQTDQIDHLKRELKAKDDKVAMVELERDLCRADIEALHVSRQMSPQPTNTCDIQRVDVNSPLDSITTASMKGLEIELAMQSGATMSSCDGSAEPETKVCHVDMSKAIQVVRRSPNIKHRDAVVGSPSLSVSSGGSTHIEEYVCNMDLRSLQGRSKPVSTSKNEKAVEVELSTGSISEVSSGTQSTATDFSSSSKEESLPLKDAVKSTPPNRLAIPVDRIRSARHRKTEMGQAPVQSSSGQLAENDNASVDQRQLRTLKLVSLGGTNKGGHEPKSTRAPEEDGSHSSSSSKENRVSAKKKPSLFKPIHPGKKQAILAPQVHAPIARKAVSPSSLPPPLSREENCSVSENSLLNDCAQNSLISNSLLAGSPVSLLVESPVSVRPERKLFGKSKMDRSGAFPTDDSENKATESVDAENESGAPKQRKSGVSLFRRRKSKDTRRDFLSSKSQEDRDSLQVQVEELSQRLRSSVEGSEDLRKRLAMISRYYETTVHRLSENIVSLKKEQTAMQVDLTKQIKNIDRERLVAVKRTQLVAKEQQIAKFKKKQSCRQ